MHHKCQISPPDRDNLWAHLCWSGPMIKILVSRYSTGGCFDPSTPWCQEDNYFKLFAKITRRATAEQHSDSSTQQGSSRESSQSVLPRCLRVNLSSSYSGKKSACLEMCSECRLHFEWLMVVFVFFLSCMLSLIFGDAAQKSFKQVSRTSWEKKDENGKIF